MEINRENYQAFLLDKQENSLSSEKEKELEVFFQENPDLLSDKEEYVLDFRLTDFPQDVLPNKEDLYKKNIGLFAFLKYSAAAVLLFAVCTYIIVKYNTNDDKVGSFTKTLSTTPKLNIENVNSKHPTHQSVVNNVLTKKEIVFDTLFLERDEEDIKGEEESLKNEIYYEYIAIAYRDEVNKDNIIKTNKILTYENDN